MFKSSISSFMTASLGILMSGLFVAALILAVRAWDNYQLAGRIARLTHTDETLFAAIVGVRAQVPRDSTALIEQDDPSPVIQASFAEATRAVAAASQALRATDLPSRESLETAVRHAWQRVGLHQADVDRQAALPRAARSLHALDDWRTAIHQLIGALGSASVTASNAVRIGDARIAELVQVRQTAWTIRDRYGLQCSLLRPSVDSNAPLPPAVRDDWIGDRAVYSSAWYGLDEQLSAPGVSSALLQLAARARAQTSAAQRAVDAIVARLGNSAAPAVTGSEWTALCDGPFEAVLAIARQAQIEASAHAEALRATSFRILLVAGLDLTVVTAFGAFAVAIVRRRFTRPMRQLTETIARLSRGEYQQPVPSPGSPDELGSMSQALEALRNSSLEAQRLQQAMSRFTADASHQMRTPLTILNAHIAVLETLVPPAHEARASLADIREAADRLERLLIQLLKLARAEGSHGPEPERAAVDLHEVIQDVAGGHMAQALQAGVELHYDDEPSDFLVPGNALMVHEMLANLLDNAIRYNRRGGHVFVRLFGTDGTAVIEVADDGPGIPAGERDKVFTRFYRLERDQDQFGSGLGLAIVQQLAAGLGVHIRLDTGPGQRGLRVTLQIPR